MCPSHLYRSFLLAVSVWGLLFVPVSIASEILIVTDSFHPVQALANVRIIQLDRPQYIKARLSKDLPVDSKQSTLLAQQRLQDRGTLFQQELMKAYQDIVDAWSLGITKIPAVVVDQHYVVYGEPDVIKAVALIEAYRRSQP